MTNTKPDKGMLHKALGVPEGKKISIGAIMKAKPMKSKEKC